MNDENIIYEGEIVRIIKSDTSQYTDLKIMYRIRNIDNRYFFAEEISTGAIFPTYCYEDNSKNKFHLRILSYLRKGIYFVFAAVESKKDVFDQYFLDVDSQRKITNVPSIEEINDYLKQSDSEFKRRIIDCEFSNEFMCDRDIIKNIINGIKVSDDLDFSEQYKTKLDLKAIEDVGYDLSTSKNLCNAVGRESEIRELIKRTCIKNSSVMLVGEAGSGKTALVEALALLIKKGNNKWLRDKTIISVSATSLIAGTRLRGTFEEKLKKLVDFSRKNSGKVILFIDEIHMLKGLGTCEEQEHLDATNMLKPFLSSKDIVIIGATTRKEYEILSQDEAFCGRFDKIDVSLLSKEMNIDILKNYIKELSNIYNVSFPYDEQETDFIVDCILDVTDIKNQRLVGETKVTNPRLSKNILEDAFVEAVYDERKEVSFYDISASILNCDKISSTIRKEMAIKLEKMLESTSLKEQSQKSGLVLSLF